MKGDFSRQTFEQKKHYTAVLMQQGRVQLDADWNEQQFINQYHLQTETRDIIGKCGAPVDNAGFKISASQDGKNLSIGQGRYYLDGILCENDGQIVYQQQPDFPNPPNIQEIFANSDTTLAIVYLDVWQRHLSYLDDSLIREIALGKPDTATRIKTIWQVKILPIKQQDLDLGRLRELLNKLVESLKTLDELIANAPNLRTELTDIITAIEAKIAPENLKSLFIKLQDVLQQAQNFVDDRGKELIKDIQTQIDLIKQEFANLPQPINCNSQLPEWNALTASRNITLNARTTTPTDQENPCLLPPQAGFQRLENQLYRLEIHQEGDLNSATFKWSRDNGSVVTAIEQIQGQEITVSDVGLDSILGFANNQWVEIVNDDLELHELPGELLQIENVNPNTRIIRLKSAPTVTYNKTQHFKLRRWDSAGELSVTIPNTNDGWIPIEDGVEGKFSAGTYKTGDYWLIPARTATGEIEWPPYEIPNTNPIPQPRLGIKHHYCRLAMVQYDDAILRVQEDCRKIFSPLPKVQTAIHITDTNWSNDDLISLQQLSANGLQITLDASPVPQSVTAATMIVTLEVPFNELSLSYILESNSITTTNNVIKWQVGGQSLEILSQLLQNKSLARMRVILKGHTIWTKQGDRLIYLDGQAFGQPGETQTGTSEPRTALIFPSGADVRASDFESWFYIGSQPLQIKSVSFISTLPGRLEQISSAGVINFPATSPQKVQFYSDEEVNVLEIIFNRSVRSDGLGENGTLQSIQVDIIDADNQLVGKIFGDIIMVSSKVVRFLARDPDRLQFAGTYRLTVFGNDTDNAPAVRAQDDDVLLDGDFNRQPGGNFELSFSVVIRPPRAPIQ